MPGLSELRRYAVCDSSGRVGALASFRLDTKPKLFAHPPEACFGSVPAVQVSIKRFEWYDRLKNGC